MNFSWNWIAGVVVAFIGVVSGVVAVVPYVEPYWYVTRVEFRTTMRGVILVEDRQTLFRLQYYLARLKQDPALATSPNLQDWKVELERQIVTVQDRIKSEGG